MAIKGKKTPGTSFWRVKLLIAGDYGLGCPDGEK